MMSFKNDRTAEINRSTPTTDTAEGSISRRDVLKKIWTTPVILAVSPSLEMSAGSPGEPDKEFEGLTPGLWRQINNENNDDKQGNDPSQNSWDGVTNYSPESSYSTVFGVQPSFGGLTFSETLELKGGSEQALARHATAALLNADNPDINYEYTEEQIKEMVQTAYNTGDFETYKDLLDAANNSGTNGE